MSSTEYFMNDEEKIAFADATMFQATELYRYIHGERHEPDDPITVMKRHIKFFDADWIGLIDFDLDVKRWSTKCFYNVNTESTTETLIEEAEGVEQALRWLHAVESRQPIVIEDIEAIRDEAPEEYKMYKRLKVKSVLAVPYMNCGTGLLVVRNPKRFKTNYYALNVMSYIITTEILAKDRRDRLANHVKVAEPTSVSEVQINMFGEMQILSKDLCLEKGDITEQMRFMIAFLATHPGKGLGLEQLTTIYASDGESWKNQIYRFRKKWKSIRNLDNDKYQLIVTTDKGYMFNPELSIKLDTEIATEFIKEIDGTADAHTKMEQIRYLYNMYRGEFLHGEVTPSPYVCNMRYQYKTMFTRKMAELLELLYSHNDYDGVILESAKVLETCPQSADVHLWRILALFKMGKLTMMKESITNAEKALDGDDYAILKAMLDSKIKEDIFISSDSGKYKCILDMQKSF